MSVGRESQGAGSSAWSVPSEKQFSLPCQRHFKRSSFVARHADGGENLPQRNEWPIHPVLLPDGCHSTFVLGVVGEEPCCAVERLNADGQLDLGRLLYVAHPLAIHIRGSDIHFLAVHDKPDRDIVGLSRLATVMRQEQCVLSRQLASVVLLRRIP